MHLAETKEKAKVFMIYNADYNINKKTPVDKGGFFWGLLGFFLPVVGLVLFLVWEGVKPKTAKATGIGALVGFIVKVLFYGITFIGCYLIGG